MATIEPQTAAHRTEAGIDYEKNIAYDNGAQEVNHDTKQESDAESENFQGGVQRVRAITSVWSKKTMIIMFCLLYLVSFADLLLQSVQGSLNAFVTSSFGKHGLLAIVSIFATILSGCCQLVIAKIIDVWGRSEGFAIMILCSVIGMIMKATCKNMETYVAAHTIYYVGHFGMMFVIDIMIADMTSLQNRMIMFGINGTPTIAVTFAGPKIADLFYTNLNFRWAFGAFAIILAGVCIPALTIMLLMQRKAEKAGLLAKAKSNDRSYLQGFIYYLIQFDIMCIVLIIAMFSMIMLPFNIVSYAPNGWKTGYIIAMEVVGVVLIPIIYIWEKYLAPVSFIDYKYLKEPTLIGAFLLYGIMFISIFTWDTYYQSYLLVVHRQSITYAGYILNAFSLTSSFFGPIFGLIIRWTGDYKYTALAGVPFMLLGTALLIPLRKPSTPVGALVVMQMLNGIGTGLFAACGQIAVMAVVTHQEIASAMAIYSLFGGIGSSIGFAIAGGLWNNIMPTELYNNLPDYAKNRTAEIFGDVTIQMSFEDGDPIRDAIVAAYADVQHKMVIAGSCLVPLCLASILLWKHINIKKVESEKGTQTKGNVF
ncbi:siderophore iron transporter mirB [Colletotrichum abscissum]|uniref:Siderophore iron transporter mirB n=3 Tax=Colletotrichum acutatum species complex TaxID=2707335 RepID=A0A9P9XRY2_9PEZI|nr:siderophore iron transporter mirB [Colletotrichum costaricense]XP_060376852.1 siderophore iron transporter mirB [Colletotrichum tamarilloi]XP_060396054.1 siderophore iron transporter mirB [Colletotrichum abscissum]KAI3545198.1 siderophore iron transporter mirB [Colletotrichum filicis]KAI3559240.1 siderophore iron transporter mirB [Colletotrichum abscissum]KAK1485507.1 siderophore iron transporter mirB [Colletotrichum tamarilloi]KAK1488741.1 siderophore iron transporter mirB [Colletotrichum